jgi:NADP-dependent 3-hydroxy acid dehydrogenase YdfG
MPGAGFAAAVMYALQAVLPPLIEARAGQVVVQTSATGEKPQSSMVSHSIMRAAANKMVRCAAMTAGPKGVCWLLVARHRLPQNVDGDLSAEAVSRAL